MAEVFTVDLITEDPENDEFVFYLVDHSPWAKNERVESLRLLQQRIYNAVDLAIYGQLAAKFPDSKGRGIRVQVDCHDDHPTEVEDLVTRINELIRTDPKFREDIAKSDFVNRIRVVTRWQMGRGL